MKNIIKNKYRYFIMGIFIFSFFCFNNVKAETTLTNDLIGYWKLDESSGDATDSVGDNTGDITDISYSTGKINNGAVFNGTSAFIDYTRLSEIEGAGAITISGWYKQTTLDQPRLFFAKNNVGGPSSANFGMYSYNDGNLYLEPNISTNRGYIDYSQYMSADTWTHIVFWFDGSGTGNSGRLKIYFNGTERTLSYSGTIETTIGNNTNSFLLGKRGNNQFYFNGAIDEIGIWTRALSSDEITELYNSGAGLQYPFEEEEPEDPDPEPQDPSNLGNGYIEFTGVILLLGIVIWSINQLNKIFYG